MAADRKIDEARGARIKHVRTELLGIRSQERFAEVLSEATGQSLTRGAVGNWELGKEIGLENLKAISELADISLDWLAYAAGDVPSKEAITARNPEAGMVRLVGYVGAGSAAHYYAVSEGELERVPAPIGATEDTVAVEVRGSSLGALFEQWLVYYDEVRSPVTNDMIGRLCVVGLLDDRVLVKMIRRSRTPGLFDLISNSVLEDPIKDTEIAWAAKVINMVPR